MLKPHSVIADDCSQASAATRSFAGIIFPAASESL